MASTSTRRCDPVQPPSEANSRFQSPGSSLPAAMPSASPPVSLLQAPGMQACPLVMSTTFAAPRQCGSTQAPSEDKAWLQPLGGSLPAALQSATPQVSLSQALGTSGGPGGPVMASTASAAVRQWGLEPRTSEANAWFQSVGGSFPTALPPSSPSPSKFQTPSMSALPAALSAASATTRPFGSSQLPSEVHGWCQPLGGGLPAMLPSASPPPRLLQASEMPACPVATSTASAAAMQHGLLQLPSKGSALHGFGQCRPCAFVHSKGCDSGALCQYCHICDAGEKKRRRNTKFAGHRDTRKEARPTRAR